MKIIKQFISMQIKHSKYISLLLFFLLFLSLNGFTQKLITFKSDNRPLNNVLNEIGAANDIRFAFDDDYLFTIKATFRVNQLPVEDFLKMLSKNYLVGYKAIGGTWVLFKEVRQTSVTEPEAIVKRDSIEKIEGLLDPELQVDPVILEPKMYTIWGNVADASTGNRIKYCRLNFTAREHTSSNFFGYFIADLSSTGKVRFQINHPGYEALDTTITIIEGQEILLRLTPNFVMFDDSYHHSVETGAVRISDYENTIILDSKAISYSSPKDNNDIATQTLIIPGLEFENGNNSGFSIRGADPSESQLEIDGIHVFNMSHLFGNVSNVNSKYINQLQVNRGGFGANSGNSTSGFISILGNDASQKSFAQVSANLLDLGVSVRLPVDSMVSISAAIRKSLTDYMPNYYSKNIAATQQLKSTGMGSWFLNDPSAIYFDFNGNLLIRPDSANEISVNIYNGSDNSVRNYSMEYDADYFMNFSSDWTAFGSSLQWDFLSNKYWTNSLIASYSKFSQNSYVDAGKYPGSSFKGKSTQYERTNDDSYELGLKWNSEVNKKNFFHQFGVEYSYNYLDFNYQFNQIQVNQDPIVTADSISGVSEKHLAQAYYQLSYAPFDWFEIRLGMRGVYDVLENEIIPLPRLGLEFSPTNDLTFYYNYGTYTQHLYQTQRFGIEMTPFSMWHLSSGKGKYLSSEQHVAGAKYQHSGLLASVEAFRRDQTGKTFFLPESSVANGVQYISQNPYAGSGKYQGVDVMMQLKYGFFSHSLAYTYSISQEMIEGCNNDKYFDSLKDKLHRLRISEMAGYDGWIFSFSWNYSTGNPYFQNTSTLEKFDFARMRTFSQIDISVVKQFQIKNIKAEAGIVFLNLLDKKNEIAFENYHIFEKTADLSVRSNTEGISFAPSFFINFRYE
jgi:ferric enterobactin receptor